VEDTAHSPQESVACATDSDDSDRPQYRSPTIERHKPIIAARGGLSQYLSNGDDRAEFRDGHLTVVCTGALPAEPSVGLQPVLTLQPKARFPLFSTGESDVSLMRKNFGTAAPL
jgi:hypothetical protein